MLSRAGYRRIEFPSREHGCPGRKHRLLHFRLAPAQTLTGKPRVNHAQDMLVNGSLREGQEDHFINGRCRALRGGIELADGLNLIAEELDAQGAIGLRWIHVKDAPAQCELARHVYRVSRGIADGSQMLKQRIDVDGLSA